GEFARAARIEDRIEGVEPGNRVIDADDEGVFHRKGQSGCRLTAAAELRSRHDRSRKASLAERRSARGGAAKRSRAIVERPRSNRRAFGPGPRSVRARTEERP